jgi:flavorubredoxin
MRSEVLYNENDHKWVVIGRDRSKPDEVIDTNEYMIISHGQTMLLDPGGTAIFPQVLTEIGRHAPMDSIKVILASHQDPDIASSLAMWLDLCPDVKVYCSWLWAGFLTHFGMGSTLKLYSIPDEGMELQIGGTNSMVYLVPAHYCHSSGNFSCYDPVADILFTGDIGAALLPNSETSLFVEDFEKHTQYMTAFHKRWMPSKIALKQWVDRVRAINPSMLCPQHGSIFHGENVKKFLDWLESLDVGEYDRTKETENINKTIWMKWK